LGGGDDPRAQPTRLAAAHALELAVLERAQQPRLERRGELADLVEEERSVGGALEATDATGDGAGEGALFVPEELALEDGGRERSTVGMHEGAASARGSPVQRTRDEPLANARFSGDQHRRCGRRHAIELFHDAAHRRALRDQRVCSPALAPRFDHTARRTRSARQLKG
jgi:hypothetical protein